MKLADITDDPDASLDRIEREAARMLVEARLKLATMSLREAAACLDCSEPRVKSLVPVIAKDSGGSVRVLLSEVQRWQEEHTVEPRR